MQSRIDGRSPCRRANCNLGRNISGERGPREDMWESGLWDSGVTRAQGVCGRGAETVAFGAREGSRGWVMEDLFIMQRSEDFMLKVKGLC